MQIRGIIVYEEAARDLEAARNFYDELEWGVGRYFLDCILADLESLRLYAGIHAMHFGFHRLLSRRFPFAIYYEVADEFVRIAAILDMRRDPAWVREELDQRT